MKRALLLFLPLLFISIVALAQKEPVIEWKTTDYDFGDIQEDGPLRAYTFTFKNSGNAPLVINKVKTSCGCTVSEYTEEPIKPGKEGFVKATFDPMNKPGKFNKIISVYANTKPDIHMLAIKGNVEARKITDADRYGFKMGNVRVKINSIQVGEISHKSENDTATFKMYNSGSEDLVISAVKTPPHIRIEHPTTIAAGKKGTFTIHYNARKKDDLGFVYDDIVMYTNDEKEPEKKFKIMAVIKTRITEMSPEELAKAAKIEFEKVHHNFGNISQNESVTTRFNLKNTGKSPLLLYRVKPSCGCTASHPGKDKLEPGDSTFITVSFDPSDMVGQTGKEITVFTNDPENEQVTLYINATVSAVVRGKK